MGTSKKQLKTLGRGMFLRIREYSLKDMSKPMGVSEYKVGNVLPEDLSEQLPSIEDIQKRIK